MDFHLRERCYTQNPNDVDCALALTCPTPQMRRWQLWGQTPMGSGYPIRTQCFGGTPPAYVPPTVTPGDVLSALRRVGLPALSTQTQPEDKTLVNFDTIFFTEPRDVSLTLTILGQAVDVVATPTSYRWTFGDGSSLVTRSAGDPYPSKTIVHRYGDAHVTMQPSVATTYSARFRVGNGAWQDIAETVTIPGPANSLRIAEATAVLSGDHQ